jgi:hypothetical protein
MSNLTYNPNVDIPPYHFDSNDGPRAMDFPSDGNFRGGRQPDISYDMNPREQYRDPRYEQQPVYQQQQPRLYEQYDIPASRNEIPVARPKRKTKERMASYEEKSDKINWILIVKKLVIYTILFLVFNHIKTHQVLCGLIPFLNNNELICMTFKGLLFAIIITILLPMVL